MIILTEALAAWASADFEAILKREIEQLDPGLLPLQQGLAQGSYANGEALKVMILSVSEGPAFIAVKAGIFYSGIIAGCSCADDPTPLDEHAEFCEIRLDIDKHTAETAVCLLPS